MYIDQDPYLNLILIHACDEEDFVNCWKIFFAENVLY